MIWLKLSSYNTFKHMTACCLWWQITAYACPAQIVCNQDAVLRSSSGEMQEYTAHEANAGQDVTIGGEQVGLRGLVLGVFELSRLVGDTAFGCLQRLSNYRCGSLVVTLHCRIDSHMLYSASSLIMFCGESIQSFELVFLHVYFYIMPEVCLSHTWPGLTNLVV